MARSSSSVVVSRERQMLRSSTARRVRAVRVSTSVDEERRLSTSGGKHEPLVGWGNYDIDILPRRPIVFGASSRGDEASGKQSRRYELTLKLENGFH